MIDALVVGLTPGVLLIVAAIPAAMLALAVQGFFELMERVVVPRGLRIIPA